MGALESVVQDTDWGGLRHAYGPASDAPAHLLALVSGDSEKCSRAVAYFHTAMLHQGSVYPAALPFIKILVGLLDDPRSDIVIAEVGPWDRKPQPLRAALIYYLVPFIEACQLDIPDAALLHDAYPIENADRHSTVCVSGVDEPATARSDAIWISPYVDAVEFTNYHSHSQTMHARAVINWRSLVVDIYRAVFPLTGDSSPAVRANAIIAALECVKHPALVDEKALLIDVMHRIARISPDATERGTIAWLLGKLDRCPDALLEDPHPNVRACAALALNFAHDPCALRELLAALDDPDAVDQWFSEPLPGQQGWLRFDLIAAAAQRAADLDSVLPVALRLVNSPRVSYEGDLVPFVRLAFPRPPAEADILSTAQRTLLSSLLAHGLAPFDEGVCHKLLDRPDSPTRQ